MKKQSLDGRAHLRTWRRSVKKNSAATCSGKEIAGLTKKKMKNIDDDTKITKSFRSEFSGTKYLGIILCILYS